MSNRAGQVTVVIDTKIGPTMRKAIDTLAIAHETAELLPQWYAIERGKLMQACEQLADECQKGLELRTETP